MFICDPCLAKYYEPVLSVESSFGHCEICQKQGVPCHDIKSMHLRRKPGKYEIVTRFKLVGGTHERNMLTYPSDDQILEFMQDHSVPANVPVRVEKHYYRRRVWE